MPPEILEKVGSVDDVLREVSKIKSIITDAVEDGVKSAVHALKKGRHAAEDAIDDARHTVKQRPFQAMGVVFAAGFLTGSILGWLGSRRR
jgi:ElaB/YqjD/DUF883 family membrane-anchored ribosome-binding protein